MRLKELKAQQEKAFKSMAEAAKKDGLKQSWLCLIRLYQNLGPSRKQGPCADALLALLCARACMRVQVVLLSTMYISHHRNIYFKLTLWLLRVYLLLK